MNWYRSSTSPLATSAVSTADGPGSTVDAKPASSAAAINRAPGSLTPGRPASETSATRSPRIEPSDDLGHARRLVVAVELEKLAPDPVTVEQDARAPRVLAEHEVRLAQLARGPGA